MKKLTVIVCVIVALVLSSWAISRFSLQSGRAVARYTLHILRDLPWITDTYRFERATPGSERSAVEQLSKELAERNTKVFIKLQNGRIAHEWYGRFHRASTQHYVASLAKAVVGSLAVLVAIDDGWIRLDDPAWRYIPYWRADPLRSAITVRDLANHSSGLEHAAPSGWQDDSDAWKQEYWTQPPRRFELALKTAPVVFQPGSRTLYSGPGYAALSYALTASLRDAPTTNIYDLLRARVMRPLGIPDHHWRIGYGIVVQQDGLDLYLSEGGARYTGRALARVGQLIADGGVWEGKQLLSGPLVDSLVRGDLGTGAVRRLWEPVSAMGWWSNVEGKWPHLPEDTIIGAGAEHQVIVVIPSRGIVIVRQGGSLGGPKWGEEYWEVLDRHLLNPLAEILNSADETFSGFKPTMA